MSEKIKRNTCVWKMVKNLDLQDDQNLLIKNRNTNASRANSKKPPKLLFKVVLHLNNWSNLEKI